MTKRTGGRKGLVHHTLLGVPITEMGKELKQDGHLEARTEVEPWRNMAYGLIPHGLLRLLSMLLNDHILEDF